MVAIILVSLVLALSHRLIEGKPKADAAYALKVIIVALIIVFIIPIFQSIAAPYISQLAIIIAYTLIILCVRYILSGRGGKIPWLSAIAISFISVVLIFIINFISLQLIGITIVEL